MQPTNNKIQTIRSIIVKECGIPKDKITQRMPFASNPNIDYFKVIAVLYRLEHAFNQRIRLDFDENYNSLQTVGGLTKLVFEKLKESQQKSM